MQKSFGGMILLTLFAFPTSALADTKVEFSGTVVAPMPCTINDKQSISTNFGDDLITSRVDGNNYIKTVDYKLECRNHSSNALKMKILGTSTVFNTAALQTNMSNLGIELRANDRPMTINTWYNFTYPAKPSLQAVPVKRSGSTLAGGSFSVNATMLLEYQ